MSRRNFWRYEPAPARPVEGGIKAHAQRGGFAAQWWGKRWIEVLEGFGIGPRLARGRSYARQGQVAQLEIAPGKIVAAVQGSRARPYQVEIGFKALSQKAWRKAAAALKERPILAARLLAGEMPQELEVVFDQAGHELFPRRRDLNTVCSCPDPSNPCKHIAAVYYLVAEALDRDPFLLLTLRGIDRDAFLELLDWGDRKAKRPRRETKTEPEELPQPLSLEPAEFWKTGGINLHRQHERTSSTVLTPLPRRLGPFPFWRGRQGFRAALEEMYEAASNDSGDAGTKLINRKKL